MNPSRFGFAEAALDGVMLAPWTDARKAFGERRIAFRLLRPPYAAAGEGVLRVLRVREGDPIEIVCGYERYRKL